MTDLNSNLLIRVFYDRKSSLFLVDNFALVTLPEVPKNSGNHKMPCLIRVTKLRPARFFFERAKFEIWCSPTPGNKSSYHKSQKRERVIYRHWNNFWSIKGYMINGYKTNHSKIPRTLQKVIFAEMTFIRPITRNRSGNDFNKANHSKVQIFNAF